MFAVLALNHHALTAWWALGENLARASWKRTGRVLLVHAGRLVERGRQLILKMCKAKMCKAKMCKAKMCKAKMCKAGTEKLQAALESMGKRSTAPDNAGPPSLHLDPSETSKTVETGGKSARHSLDTKI